MIVKLIGETFLQRRLTYYIKGCRSLYNLRNVVEQTGCKIVISSKWRFDSSGGEQVLQQ